MSDEADETTVLSPNFGTDGLIAAIAQDRTSRDILMLAWMNRDALDKTSESGEAWYWSRSRGQLWHKGATSGAIQTVHEIRIDCDQDAVILLVDQAGAGACHTRRTGCFYRKIDTAADGKTKILKFL